MTGLKAIAAEAGVAPSTASFVLNGRADAVRISEATRSRVLDAARRLGYAPNVAARRLRVARTTVGAPVLAILAPIDARLSLISRVVHGVRDALAAAGGTVRASGEAGQAGQAKQPEPGAPWEEPELLIETYTPGGLAQHRSLRNNQRIHGAIVLNATPADEAFLEASDPAVPVVLFQRTSRHNFVQLDNTVSGRLVAEHLVGLGHRTFGALVPAVESAAITARYESFRDALAGVGIAPERVTPIAAQFSEAGGKLALEQLLHVTRNSPRVTAVFALSDSLALGAIRAAKDAGLRVPEDLSVIGHDGLEMSAYFDPPLTTVASPASEMGARAAQILLDVVQRRVEGPVQETFLPHLILRRSTAPPR